MRASFNRPTIVLGLACGLALVAIPAFAGPVTWTIQPGGNYTLGGETTVSTFPTTTWPNQSAGSATSALSGSFTTTNTFRTSIDFGDSPDSSKPPAPEVVDDNNPTPEEIAALDQYASVTLPNWAQSTLGVAFANANSAPSTPGVMPYFWNVTTPFPNPPAEPAVFGVMVNSFFQMAGEPLAFRDYRQGFYTNKSDPNVTYGDDAAYFPGDAPVNQTTGQFDAAAAGIFSSVNLDARLTALSYVGRIPTTGEDGNVPTTPGVIGRDGPKWTMSLPLALFTYLVDPDNTIDDDMDPSTPEVYIGPDDRWDRFDFPGDVDTPGDPSTYLSALYIWVGGSGSLTAVANIVPGDANFDGKVVDIFDINMISSNWSGGAIVGNLTPGDVNGDGAVDIFDVNLVSSNWAATGGGAGVGAAAAVPEPSGVVLAVLGALGALAVARSRRRFARCSAGNQQPSQYPG